MRWRVETVAEFDRWWVECSEAERESIDAHVRLLEARGPALGRPYVDTVAASRHPNMKELRVQHRGRPLRVLFAFDPRRVAVLLLGGDKTGKGRWYAVNISRADRLYDRHLKLIEESEMGNDREWS